MNTRKIKFGLIITAIVFGIIFIFQYNGEKSSSYLNNSKTQAGIPVRMLIPRIDMNAEIEVITKDESGYPTPPKLALNTGWYDLGVKPGEEGTAVIYGYVYWKNGYTARFSDLHFSKPGDFIEIIDDKDIITTFVVVEVKKYNLDTDISKLYESNDGKSHLNLITYDGAWDEATESYSKRVVVFTEKESTSTLSDRKAIENTAKIMSDRITYDLEILNQKALSAPPGLANQVANQ